MVMALWQLSMIARRVQYIYTFLLNIINIQQTSYFSIELPVMLGPNFLSGSLSRFLVCRSVFDMHFSII